MSHALISIIRRFTAVTAAATLAAACANSSATAPVPPGACPEQSNKILVDASHDGGGWWFPQSGPFAPDSTHQGQALAEYLRSKGYVVDELGRGTPVDSTLLAGYAKVIRAGSFGAYSSSELRAYEHLASCPVTIVLLGDYLNPGQGDALAVRLGVTFRGSFNGNIVTFASHPITAGVSGVPFMVGAEVDTSTSHSVHVLGWLTTGEPVMGIVTNLRAKVFFIGDMNGIEGVPQPLVDNLVAWGF